MNEPSRHRETRHDDTAHSKDRKPARRRGRLVAGTLCVCLSLVCFLLASDRLVEQFAAMSGLLQLALDPVARLIDLVAIPLAVTLMVGGLLMLFAKRAPGSDDTLF